MRTLKSFILALITIAAVSACTGQNTIPEPEIGKLSVSDITAYSAMISGSVIVPATTDRLEFGIELSTDETFDPSKTRKSEADAEEFSIAVKGLEADRRYFARTYYISYNTSGNKYLYGEAVNFLTSSIQVDVTTGEATAVTQTGATLSGSLVSNKYGQSYWFLYSDKCEELEDLKTSGIKAIASGNDSKFAVTLSGLTASTPYFYVACAHVEGIDFYGDVKSFTTAKEVTPTPPTPSKGWPGWFELPAVSDADGNRIDDNDPTLYYARHSFSMNGRQLRNYTVCFSSEHHCPVWVAAPRHNVYEGSTSRTDAYKADPDIPSNIQYSSKETGGGCNKGHMVGSAERKCNAEANRQVFYYSNIAPQLSSGFNTGGGGWNLLEDWVDGQVCSDTLYVVIGCYFDEYTDGYGETVSPKTISFGGRNDVSFPTMFYYILLRTKNGNTRKPLSQCSATDLKCAAFVRSHTNEHKGQDPSRKEMMSVADLEKITGFTYFPNVPNAPKSTYSASEWGL